MDGLLVSFPFENSQWSFFRQSKPLITSGCSECQKSRLGLLWGWLLEYSFWSSELWIGLLLSLFCHLRGANYYRHICPTVFLFQNLFLAPPKKWKNGRICVNVLEEIKELAKKSLGQFSVPFMLLHVHSQFFRGSFNRFQVLIDFFRFSLQLLHIKYDPSPSLVSAPKRPFFSIFKVLSQLLISSTQPHVT